MVEIVQTCDKCERKRTLSSQNGSTSFDSSRRETGGWRVLNGKDVCAPCINTFLNGAL